MTRSPLTDRLEIEVGGAPALPSTTGLVAGSADTWDGPDDIRLVNPDIAQVAGLSRLEFDRRGEFVEEAIAAAGAQVIGHARDQPFEPESAVVADRGVEEREVVTRAELAVRIAIVDTGRANGDAASIRLLPRTLGERTGTQRIIVSYPGP